MNHSHANELGSSLGYATFKEVIENPSHENFEATMEWVNYYFDLLTENDSVEKINERLVLSLNTTIVFDVYLAIRCE